MTTPTDEDLVLGFRPEATMESQPGHRPGATKYRVAYVPVPGSRVERIGWVHTEAMAWRAACVRMGLRSA